MEKMTKLINLIDSMQQCTNVNWKLRLETDNIDSQKFYIKADYLLALHTICLKLGNCDELIIYCEGYLDAMNDNFNIN
jgi:hypothetical protein